MIAWSDMSRFYIQPIPREGRDRPPLLASDRTRGPDALEAVTDLGVVRGARQFLEPSPDVRDVERLSLTRHDPFDVEHVLRSSCERLVDDQVLGRAEPHLSAAAEIVRDGPGHDMLFVPREPEAQIRLATAPDGHRRHAARPRARHRGTAARGGRG